MRGAFLQNEDLIDFIVLAPNNAFQHVLTVLKLIEIQVFVFGSSVFGLRSSFCRHPTLGAGHFQVHVGFGRIRELTVLLNNVLLFSVPLGIQNTRGSRSHLRETQCSTSVDTTPVSTLWCFESPGEH